MSQELIDSLTAEKVALDQSYVIVLQQAVDLRKQIFLKDKALIDLNNQLQEVIKERDHFKSTVEKLASDSQASEG